MEVTKVVPEDLSLTFKSKQDLYRVLTIDCKQLIIKIKHSKVLSSKV